MTSALSRLRSQKLFSFGLKCARKVRQTFRQIARALLDVLRKVIQSFHRVRESLLGLLLHRCRDGTPRRSDIGEKRGMARLLRRR